MIKESESASSPEYKSITPVLCSSGRIVLYDDKEYNTLTMAAVKLPAGDLLIHATRLNPYNAKISVHKPMKTKLVFYKISNHHKCLS